MSLNGLACGFDTHRVCIFHKACMRCFLEGQNAGIKAWAFIYAHPLYGCELLRCRVL